MNISITIPSRLRLDLLEMCIKAWFDLAESPDLIETNIMCDSDDSLTHDFLYKIKEKYPNVIPHIVEITPQMRQEGLNIHDLFFNPGARKATGKYVWGTGNDVEIKVKYYDKIICEKIEEFLQDKPDRILYCKVNNDKLNSPLTSGACTFPITTKETVSVIGGTVPNEITSWGGDIALFNIYNTLKANRILDLSDRILIWHWSHHTGRTGPIGDEVAHTLNTNVQFLTPLQQKVYVDKLNSRLLEFKMIQ